MKMHLTRAISLDATGADKAQRRVPAVLSTQYPVDRGGYREVLLHAPENIDLSRAPLPLIESHDGSRLNIGVVDNLRATGGKLRGDIVFGSSARANEVWTDVESGIVRNLSIGYTIQSHRQRGGNTDVVEATRWAPHEVSLVSIPADPTAGIHRNLLMTDSLENLSSANAEETRLSRGQRRALHAQEAFAGPSEAERQFIADRERRREIIEMGRAYRHVLPGSEMHDLVESMLKDGHSTDVMRGVLLERSARPATPNADTFDPLASQHHGGREFSIVRALRSMIDPRNTDAGYEREVSQEIARKTGRAARGIYMPIGDLHKRTLSASGAPALIGTQFAGAQFIDILRAQSVVMNLGPMTMTGLSENLSIPRLSASATAQWIAGDGSDGVNDTTPTFDAVTLSPKTLGGMVLLSRKMLLQNVDAENIVLGDLGKVIATEIDRAAFNGTGTSNQPTGILHTAGIATGSFAAAAPTFGEVVAMESALTGANADASNAAYVTSPALAGTLKTTLKAQYAADMIWTANDTSGAGTVNGLRAFASTNLPAKTMLLGNFSDFIIGMWGGVDLEIDPYWDFSKGTVGVRALLSLDFGVRHPQSFAAYTTP